MFDESVFPSKIVGNGRQCGSFVDFLHDAHVDTYNELMQLTWEQAEALAGYVSSHYVLAPRKDLQ